MWVNVWPLRNGYKLLTCICNNSAGMKFLSRKFVRIFSLHIPFIFVIRRKRRPSCDSQSSSSDLSTCCVVDYWYWKLIKVLFPVNLWVRLCVCRRYLGDAIASHPRKTYAQIERWSPSSKLKQVEQFQRPQTFTISHRQKNKQKVHHKCAPWWAVQ